MDIAPKYSDLASMVGISRSYASEIVDGIRTPSRPLAIRIYRHTGWKTANIASLSEDQISMLEQIEAAA